MFSYLYIRHKMFWNAQQAFFFNYFQRQDTKVFSNRISCLRVGSVRSRFQGKNDWKYLEWFKWIARVFQQRLPDSLLPVRFACSYRLLTYLFIYSGAITIHNLLNACTNSFTLASENLKYICTFMCKQAFVFHEVLFEALLEILSWSNIKSQCIKLHTIIFEGGKENIYNIVMNYPWSLID